MGQLSLARNLQGATTFEDLKLQIGEFVSLLEDHLNSRVNISLINSAREAKQVLETLKKGDLVFDFKTPGVATLQQWDGFRFITFNLANFEGYINLITQGIGSGNNPSLFLRSDGADHWVLDTPTQFDTANIAATENLSALSLVTANGKIADSNNLAHFNHVVGITMFAVLSGNVATVVVEGEVTDGSWTWVNNDKLFLNGTTLSTIPPTTGAFCQYIALAKSNQTIHIRLQKPIRL